MVDGLLLTAAFSAGIATVFSPCATALLPAYLSYYLTRSAHKDAAPPDGRTSRLLTGGILLAILGSALLVFALVDRVLSFGDRATIDVAIGLSGGFLLAVGAYVAWEGAKDLDPTLRKTVRARVARGIVVGGTASLGIATVYLAIGIALTAGLSRFPSALPWVAFGSAALIVALGVLLLLGRNIATFVPRLRMPSGASLGTFFLFGIGYALIASGCFLPVFGLVIGAALSAGFADAAQVMLTYASGSALVFIMISASAGAAEGIVFRRLREWRRHVHRVAGAIVVTMGTYILWYDWTFLLSRGV